MEETLMMVTGFARICAVISDSNSSIGSFTRTWVSRGTVLCSMGVAGSGKVGAPDGTPGGCADSLLPPALAAAVVAVAVEVDSSARGGSRDDNDDDDDEKEVVAAPPDE